MTYSEGVCAFYLATCPAAPDVSDAPISSSDSVGFSGGSSPPDSANDLLRRFIMQEEGRDVLSPSSSKETYSRKVFIGGLPPDIDEGKNPKFIILITLREMLG